MSLAVDIPEPRAILFEAWAAVVSGELSQYNVGTPRPGENWQVWALKLVNVPELAAEGLPNPTEFTEWPDWAAGVFTVLQG